MGSCTGSSAAGVALLLGLEEAGARLEELLGGCCGPVPVDGHGLAHRWWWWEERREAAGARAGEEQDEEGARAMGC